MKYSSVHGRRRLLAILLALAVAAPAALFAGSAIQPAGSQTISFASTEVLGTPTDTSIRVNIIPAETVSLFFEYGTTSGVYTNQTPTLTATANEAHEVQITGLQPNTRYFYRTRYIHPNAPGVTEARPELTFHTARSEGEPFTFTVTSDSHIGTGANARYSQATNNIAADQPDFNVDTGDTFIIDNLTTQTAVDAVYRNQRTFFDNYAGSTPLFLSPGNHEEEEGWNLDDAVSAGVFSIRARKRFFPTPVDGGFYSANTDPLALAGNDPHDPTRNNLREDYYAFEWGDALFVVIDEYQYTDTKPYPGAVAGEQNDEAVTGDQWEWTLGQQQYDWFNDTLKNSDARFKFVFSHHMLGGQLAGGGTAGPAGYVRGGAAGADFFEWGGKNPDGSDGFAANRPTFAHGPIQQIMLESGVTAYYHGHDHQYAYEVVDGITYQAMPSPGMTGSGFGLYTEGANNGETIRVLPNSGHVRVAIDPDTGLATSEYVRSDATVPGTNGDVSHTYTMAANSGPAPNEPPTITAVPEVISVQAGETEVVDLTTNDLDGDPLTTSITSGPSFATLVGGDLSLAPTLADVAGSPYTVTVQVDDGEDTDSVDVTVTVTAPPNQPPTITAVPEVISVQAGQTEVVDLTTNDLDGDPLTTSITSGPSFATLVGGDLSLAPTLADVAGSPYTVTVQVDDGEDTDSVDVTVTVTAPPNQPPTITAVPEVISVEAGQTEVVDLTTNDLDGDPLTTSITSGPSFATLVGGDLSLAPTLGDVAGSPYTVTVQVDDGEDTDSVDVTVNVTGPVDPPEGGTFGDFDGDGDTDRAVFRPTGGRWYINGIAGNTQWGVNGDKPVAADYDGDGDTEIAVFRPSSGRWYINGVAGSTQWGVNGDVPVPGDYDGDGDANIAVFRPSNGRWYVNGIAGSTPWGLNGDVAVPGDYDGDGDTDFAVFRPTNGRWYVNGIAGSVQFGANGDVPVAADWDGDGTTERAVFRGAGGQWFVEGVAGSVQWGLNGDVAVPGDYDGDGTIDRAVWRPASGRWYVEGIAGNVQWGSTGDIPSPRPIGTL